MKPERFRWLAAVIYAHPNHEVVGRIRLQKMMQLLQRLGLPSDYGFRIHHYGPYSEGIQSDIGLLERMDMVQEDTNMSQSGRLYSKFKAGEDYQPDEITDKVSELREQITRMSKEDPVILELAATYDTFFEKTNNHDRALDLTRRMKGTKCDGGNIDRALTLLVDLELQGQDGHAQRRPASALR